MPKPPTKPPRETHADRLLACLSEGPNGEADFAVGRILCGADPAWPNEPSTVALLHVWPGHRRLSALRLQSLITAGASLSLPIIAPELLRGYVCSKRHEEGALGLARYWAQHWANGLARDWARDWARYWARYLARYWARYLARDWAKHWVRDWNHDWTQDRAQKWARELVGDLAGYSGSDWVRRWAHDWAKNIGLDASQPANIDFALWEVSSLGRPAVRTRLARLDPEHTQESLPVVLRLLSQAARVSLYPGCDANGFDLALRAHDDSNGSDPLWSALARHLAWRSTREDKALLEDGTVVTLDELCDQHNLPHLPYLEDMPTELDIDWEGDEEDKPRPKLKSSRK